jgi:hypothetical protein
MDQYTFKTTEYINSVNNCSELSVEQKNNICEYMENFNTFYIYVRELIEPIAYCTIDKVRLIRKDHFDNFKELIIKLQINSEREVELTKYRQNDADFITFLNDLRDGIVTAAQWEWVNQRCSEEAIVTRMGRTWFNNKFLGPETVHIYFTNKEGSDHNVKALNDLRQPILRIDAEHDTASSKSKSSDLVNRLQPRFYLCRGAKCMLVHNLWTSKGLVNGSSGIIKDFVFDTKNYTVGDSTLPLAIIVEFAEYNGQPFFTLPGQEKWVPLLPQKCESGEGNSNKHFRKSFQ